MSDLATTPEQGNALSIDDAVNAILTPEPVEDGTTEAQSRDLDAQVQGQDNLPETVDTVDVEEPAEIEASDQIDDEEPEAEAEEPDQPTYTVKVDGEDVEVNLDELRTGYTRQKTWTQRMMAAAEDQKKFDADVAKFASERAEYAQRLDAVEQILASASPERSQAQWDQLYEEDPIGYVREREQHREQQEKLHAVQAEKQRVSQAQQEQFAAAKQSHLAEQSRLIPEIIPEWSDPATARAEAGRMKEYLVSEGYTPAEVTNITEARHLKTVRDAMLYREMSASAEVAKKKVSKAPKMVKGGKSKSAREQTAGVKKQRMDRVKRTGSVQDAVAYLMGN